MLPSTRAPEPRRARPPSPNEFRSRHRTGLGWYRDFTRQFGLTAEYDWVHNELTKTTNDQTFGLELQSNF